MSADDLTRRQFLAAVGAGSLAAAVPDIMASTLATPAARTDAPNILILMCDQLSQRAVGAYGDAQKVTPNIDAIAAGGARFAKAYVQCPLCMPLRASMWTGRYPHETTVMSNYGPGCGKTPADMVTLGKVFSAGGYLTAHFGKTHDAGSLRGFSHVETETAAEGVEGTKFAPAFEASKRDRHATDKCIEFLQKKHDRPFLAVASLVNPHEICGWMGPLNSKGVPVVEKGAYDGELPELPENFEIEDLADRPIPIQYLCCSHRRLAQACRWTKDEYRTYLAAYYEYVRRADAEIGRILKTLQQSPAGANTLVVFLSDHGEGMACHRMVTKETQFYEETTRVPLIFAGPGVSGRDLVIDRPLASLLDIFPTLCDYAGLDVPEKMRGVSLMPYLRGEKVANDRKFVVGEWYTEAGFAGIVTPGRMIRTQRYKYTRYVEGDGEELFDLQNDPMEKRTLHKDPAYADVLDEHRNLLKEHVEAIGDPFFSMKANRPGTRHSLGYMHHGQAKT